MSVTTTNDLRRRRFALMAKEHAQRIGRRLRKRRLELGLNQREVADRMKNRAVSNQHVSNWERGVYKPSDENLSDLAQALELDGIAYFYADEPQKETPDLIGALSGGTATEQILASLDALRAEIAELARRLPPEDSVPPPGTGGEADDPPKAA